MNNENKNIGHFVFFGPANVGKSTMIGYIMSYNWHVEIFNAEVNKIKERIGENYQTRRLYSYFVDEAKDEYTKNVALSFGISHGTSKYHHIKNIGDFVLIDTPGGNEYETQRYKGLSLAKIGIFAIEIQQLLGLQEKLEKGETQGYLKTVKDFFCSWYVWDKLHGAKNAIILLTKYDLRPGKDNYEKSKKVLYSIIGKEIEDLVIIPTGISIENREDTNIFSRLNCNWYNGKTLIEAIKEKNEFIKENKNTEKILMFYNKVYGNVNGVGNVIRWKIDSGFINLRDRLAIAPVLIGKRYEKIIASIKSMTYVNDNKILEFANTGDIVDVSISNVIYDNTTIPKDKIEISNTSIITGVEEIIRIGREIIGFIHLRSCKKDERNILKSIKSNDHVRILWFGKVLTPEVIEINHEDEERTLLKLSLNNKCVALPENFLPRKILLQTIENDESKLPINFECVITDILNENY